MGNRRRWLLVLAAVSAVLALAMGSWPRRPRTAITWENAAQVRPGMTLPEVETVLGGPARYEATAPISYCLLEAEGFDPAAPRPPEWVSDEVRVMVYLDGDHRVQRCAPVVVRREGFVQIVRRWFGL